MITFLVLPLLFFVYGCFLVVADVRQHILKLRVTVEGSREVIEGKLLSILATAAAVVLACAGLSGVLGLVLRPLPQLVPKDEFGFEVVVGTMNNPALQMLFSMAVSDFFGILGFCIGLLTRAVLIPSVVALLSILVLPFAGAGTRAISCHLQVGASSTTGRDSFLARCSQFQSFGVSSSWRAL